jgi:hypothetical protein
MENPGQLSVEINRSKDHSEFLVGISIRELNALYSKAIEIGLVVDSDEQA